MKDKFGPEYVLRVYDPKIGMEGFLIIDNTALGPGKGGIRMTPNVTEEEIFRLSRTMTWKNALAEIPFGGAKAGIVWKGGDIETKKAFVQSFAKKIKCMTPKKYIAGPDINTGECEMQWFVEATGDWRSATGKPENVCMKIFKKDWEKCGIPHEKGSTGYGVAQSVKISAEFLKMDLTKTGIAIHGFGNVGTFTFKFLSEAGAKIVAIADTTASVYDESGLDKKIVSGLIYRKESLDKYPKEKRIAPDDFWSLPIDILIPASVTDIINEKNKNNIKAKLIVEAGNIPMSDEIEKEFFNKGIMIVPDFVANAGGVISSYSEYKGYHPKKMLEMVDRKISKNLRIILKESIKKGKNPREAGIEIAMKRIEKKMKI